MRKYVLSLLFVFLMLGQAGALENESLCMPREPLDPAADDLRVQESDFTEAAALESLKYLEEDAPDRLIELANELGGDLEDQTEFWIGYSNSLITVHGYLLKQRALEAPPSEREGRVKDFCAYLDGRSWVD